MEGRNFHSLAEHVFGVYAKLLGIHDIQGMFGIDEGCNTIAFLGFSHHVKSQRGFARRLRPKDFNDPPSRYTPHSQGVVQGKRAV